MAMTRVPGWAPPTTEPRRGSTKGREFKNRIGLPTASAFVIGSIIGTGVFALPSALAPYGPSSLLAIGLVSIGALALAQVFGWLNQRAPGSGGPYLYARDACNTEHLHLDEPRRHTSAQMVDLVEETAEAASRFDHRYLLLSSSETRRTGLYHRALGKRGVRSVDVSDTDQLDLDDIVHSVMAHELDSAGAQIDELVLRLESEPFDGIIAACTELPIALDHSDVADALPVIDSNRVLARALVDTFFRIRRTGPVLVRVG